MTTSSKIYNRYLQQTKNCAFGMFVVFETNTRKEYQKLIERIVEVSFKEGYYCRTIESKDKE